VTDEDVYGKVLGKGFDGVRAELCRPESDFDENADRLALYNVRRFLPPGSADFVERIRAASTALDGRGGLFAQNEAQRTLEAAATDSLADQQVARAFAAACVAQSGARAFLENVADYVCDATRAIAHVQKNYKDDTDCHAAIDRVTPAAKARVADDLAERCGIGGKRIARPARRGPDDLLDFVVATG
jgi:hypothetical protein